eukprot:CAMPEP_0202439488 /NCGR_PEP_ID=MMETSP1345-20130828/36188_1 /ASSEMBLY_ACC=CAM_ASM_000843 /TAXON_ID=342563 /ORGANISM="Fabrea Fabrea salina" /LENGTH=324 /DNA_ID=CAMNT_0049054023 /DNA_START=21 /DNA_END=992 /DNA_ORIENTATION=+
MVLGHIKQGHSASAFTEADEVNEVLSIISCKRQEVTQLRKLILSEVEKTTYEQLTQLKQLSDAVVESYSAIPDTLGQVTQFLPSDFFNQLISQLGFKNQLQEVQVQTEQITESYKQKERVFQERITALTDELQKAKKKNEQLQKQLTDREQAIQELRKEKAPGQRAMDLEIGLPTVVSASADRSIRVWGDGDVRVLKGHTAGVCSLAVSQSKKVLVSGSGDSTIQLWSLAAREEALEGYSDAPSAARFQVLKGHGREVFSVAISSKDEFLVSGSADKTLRVWSLPSGQMTLVLTGHIKAVTSVAISSDDKFIVSGSYDTTLRVW